MGMDQYIYTVFPSREATALHCQTGPDQRQYVQAFRKDYDMHKAILPFYLATVADETGESITENDVMGDAYMGIRLTPAMLDAIESHRPSPCRDVMGESSATCTTCHKDEIVYAAVKMARMALAQDMMVYYSADW